MRLDNFFGGLVALATSLTVTLAVLMCPNTAQADYTFGDWASDQGYNPGDAMSWSVDAGASSPAIDSLGGIDDYNWTTAPTIRLYLKNNQISNIESGTFSGLTSLAFLYLNSNQITSIESGDFSGLTNLAALSLSLNQITSIESSDFSGLTGELGTLSLYGNQISSIEPGDFSRLPNLTVLYLGGNQISSIESVDFSDLQNLSSLSLGGQISSIESGDFSDLPNLEWLDLSGNQIPSIESGDFSGLTNLKGLYLADNQISSIESVDFSDLTNLEMLVLEGNPISSIESDDFSGLANLETLYLAGNQISSIESGSFSALTSLTRLDLGDNPISSIESGAFSGMPNLKELLLYSNPAMTELNLGGTHLPSLNEFEVRGNASITSVSLKNAVLSQRVLAVLLDGGDPLWPRVGIGELRGITELDLSGVNFGRFSDLSPLYAMDDLTDLWLVDVLNLDASQLDLMLDELTTIEGTDFEGILYMTQTDFDGLNTAGNGLLADWDDEPGHHVHIVPIPEPTTLALLAIASFCLVPWLRRRTQA